MPEIGSGRAAGVILQRFGCSRFKLGPLFPFRFRFFPFGADFATVVLWGSGVKTEGPGIVSEVALAICTGTGGPTSG